MAFSDLKINKSRSSSSLLATSPPLPIPNTKYTNDESSKKKNFLSRSSHHSYSLNKILMNANHIINGSNGHGPPPAPPTATSSNRKKMSQTNSWPVRFSDSSNVENDDTIGNENGKTSMARRRDRFLNKFGMRKSKASVPGPFYPNFPMNSGNGENSPTSNNWPYRAHEQNMSFSSAKATGSSKINTKKHLRNKSASNLNDIYINIIKNLETSDFNQNMSSAINTQSAQQQQHPPLTLSSSNPSSTSSQPASPVAPTPGQQANSTLAHATSNHVNGGDTNESNTLNNNVDGSNTQHIGNGVQQTNGLLTATTTNSTGSGTPAQVTPNSSVISNTSPSNGASSTSNPSMNGFLLKWTNYIKGYQKRWFVLHNGILSYFRSPTEMQHTCRGAISLENAEINFDDAQCITVSNGTNQTFHLKASSEHEKQKWVNALEAAKKLRQGSSGVGGGGGASHVGNANMNKPMFMLQQNESDDEDDTLEAEKAELEAMLHGLQEKLNELNLSQDFIQKHMNALSKSLNELNNLQGKPEDMVIKTINERSGICKIALIGMTTQCQAFIKLAQKQAEKMNKISQLEREQRLRLEEMVQDMAKQQSNIELQLTKRSKEKKTAKNNTQQPVVGLVQPDHSKHQPAQGAEQTLNSKQKLAGQALFPAPVNSSDTTDAASNSSQLQSTTSKKTNESKSVDQSSQELKQNKSNQDDEGEEEDQLNDDEFHDAVEEINFSVTLPRNQPGGAAAALMHHNRNPSSLSKLYLQESDETSDDEDHQTIKVTMHKNKEEGKGAVGATTTGKEVVHVSQHSKKPSSNDLSMLKGQIRPVRPRRTTITPRPNYSFNLWSIMKNCIGKDLSKIPIPVNFSEPLSMLQRITEELEYSDILDKAAACDDQWEQMAYIAAFTISSYSTTATRTNKPFNPLLGETFECDRLGDYGWRSVAEQVSHHPPGAAMHVESLKGWEYYQEFTMSSKFRGQYLQIIPLGTAHLEFKKTGYHYTWRKIVTFVRNIIVGKLWIDNVGEMDIINHTTKDVCHLKYFAYSYFSRDPPRKVTGIITDSNNVARYVLNGTWTEQIEGAPVLNPQVVTQQTQLNTGKSKILWKRRYPPPHLETMYNFTELAIQLNEPEEGVAPSDSRLRPDQRLMEEAKWDEANIEKVRLEEKQRTLRKKREQEYAQKHQHLASSDSTTTTSSSNMNANNSSSDQSMNDDAGDYNAQLQQLHANASPHDPDAAWFRKTIDPYTNQPIHVFKNDYWDCKAKQDWSRCPDLF